MVAPASRSNMLIMVLIGLVMLGIGLPAGYFIANSNKQTLNTSISPSPTPSVIPTVGATADKKISPPQDVKNEITTTQLKVISVSSTEGWKSITFKGVSFKIPADLTFKDLQESSNIGIIYREGQVGGPSATIGVQNYKGGSRRQEYFGNNYYDCHYIYEEAMFGKVKALQIAADLNWCQGGAGAIVTVAGNKLVSVGPSLQYDVATKKILREPLNDTIVSTITSTLPALNTGTKVGWKSYTDSSYGYTLQYPTGWILSQEKDAEGAASISLVSSSATQAGSTGSKLPILYIGIRSPYSTSGAICANEWCTETTPLNVVIKDQKVTIPVTKGEVGSERQFDFYAFKFPLPGKNILPSGYTESIELQAFAWYKTAEEAQTILSILSTLTY